MKKNRIAHSGEIGICAMASGYTTNAKPGPVSKTARQNQQCAHERPTKAGYPSLPLRVQNRLGKSAVIYAFNPHPKELVQLSPELCLLSRNP